MSSDKMVEEIISKLSQDVSYKLSDLILSYPEPLRAVAMATVTACISSNLPTMPKAERELYETALSKMVVATIPPALDPRKWGGPRS